MERRWSPVDETALLGDPAYIDLNDLKYMVEFMYTIVKVKGSEVESEIPARAPWFTNALRGPTTAVYNSGLNKYII